MSDYDPYENFPQNRPMPHPGTSSNYDYADANRCPLCGETREVCRCPEWDEPTDEELPDTPMMIEKMGYQHLPEIECPHCETATIYTDDGVDEEGDPHGAIYCVQCNRRFEQAFEVKIVTQEDAEEDVPEDYRCEYCNGTGWDETASLPCEVCGGDGWDW